MTPADLRTIISENLVVDAPIVAAALHMSTWAVFDAVKRGDLGIEPLRVGRRLKFRTADLAALLGVQP